MTENKQKDNITVKTGDCHSMTKGQHHTGLEYLNPTMRKKLNKIRSSTLRNLVVLYTAWKEKNKSFMGMSVRPDQKWVMENLNCSMRTAYDYAIALSYFFDVEESSFVALGEMMNRDKKGGN